MSVPHPIPYQGSKRNLARIIISFIADDVERLIEPFAGSAAVTLAAAYYRKADTFSLCDINAPLMRLWDTIINQPDQLADAYEELWMAQKGREREYYDQVRMDFNTTHHPAYLLYLLARCVKAAVRYNPKGEFNQSPDNRRSGRHPARMRQDIRNASSLLKGKTHLMSGDFREVLELTSTLDVVYMDPPYQGVSENRDPRYYKALVFDTFIHVLADLNSRNISFILSYDGRTGSKAYGQPLPDWLGLKRLEINAGRSSQATLLGYTAHTIESLYLSPALIARIETDSKVLLDRKDVAQLSLL